MQNGTLRINGSYCTKAWYCSSIAWNKVIKDWSFGFPILLKSPSLQSNPWSVMYQPYYLICMWTVKNSMWIWGQWPRVHWFTSRKKLWEQDVVNIICMWLIPVLFYFSKLIIAISLVSQECKVLQSYLYKKPHVFLSL